MELLKLVIVDDEAILLQGLLQTYDWEQMSHDREERVLLICDEEYLMIDQKVPQSLVYSCYRKCNERRAGNRGH